MKVRATVELHALIIHKQQIKLHHEELRPQWVRHMAAMDNPFGAMTVHLRTQYEGNIRLLSFSVTHIFTSTGVNDNDGERL